MYTIETKLSGSYIVEEIKSTDDFLNLREEWNRLVFEDTNSTIFQTWEWNFNIWKHDEAKLKNLSILLVRERNGNLIGIAPFFSYEKIILGFRIRIIELIGKNFTDYRDFIVRPECNMQVYTEILSWLNENSIKWDIVDLQYISEESPVFKNYNILFRDFRANIQQQNICPYLTLYPDRDLYENLHSQTLIKYLKRKTRKLEKDLNYRFLTVSSLSELDSHLDKLFDLHRKRRNQKLQFGMFRSENQEQLFTNLSHDLLERGYLKLSFLFIDDQPATCLYNFEFKNKVYFYQSGLDPNSKFTKYSLGYIIHSLAIREALKEGMEEYDFLSGNEDYKKDWTENYRTLYRIKIISSDFKKAIFNTNEKLSNFWYGSKFRKSKLIRKLYFWSKNLGKNHKEKANTNST